MRFTLRKEKMDNFKIKFDEFMQEIYGSEGGIEYFRLQHDFEIFDENNKQLKSMGFTPSTSDQLKRSYTAMIVADPNRIQLKKPAQNNLSSEKENML